MNGFFARWSTFSRPATGFVTAPEPRTIGSFAKGRQLIAGNFLFAGMLVEAKGTSIWQLDMPSPEFEDEIHGFTWLDDLAAVGDLEARQLAQAWLNEWMDVYGRGKGIGWTPDLTGRRLIRWINHAIFLLNGQESKVSEAYFRSLAQQTNFLARRWRAASHGLPRFEALTGLIYAGLALTGMERHVDKAKDALDRESKRSVDDEGGIPTRNPEDLLEVFTLLNWASMALVDADRIPADEHIGAIERIAPTLRMLRHSDGSLARFHGGGRGAEGRLDHALANSGVKGLAPPGLSMGFVRLHGGRTSIILDASEPPKGAASYNAHASALAMEVTSGRRPLIVNCGSGVSFGPDWRRAGRATASHSTLSLDGHSSASLTKAGWRTDERRELLIDGPEDVRVQYLMEEGSQGVIIGHDGYREKHGLTHIRKIELSNDGRAIVGEDTLAAIEKPDRKIFDNALDTVRLQGIPFRVRFHLHPDVDAEIDMGGAAVSLALKSGEIWVFRFDGGSELTLEPSVYLEKGRLKPRATKQMVLSAHALEYATRIRWTLAKAQDTPDAVRDLVREDEVLPI